MLRILPILAVAFTGCLTHADHVRDVRAAFYSGNMPQAKAKIDAAAKKHTREADVLKLDAAMVLLCEGKPKEAEAILRLVRDAFDANEGKDAGEEVKAMLLDDQQRAYAGEDYEKVLIRFMLAMCNLMGDGSDAAAYALQVNQKQQQIIEHSKCKTADGQNLKANYKLVAAGEYLHAAIREESHSNYDDVARSLEHVAKWQPDFTPVKADLERAKTGHHSQPGHGVVYVFAFTGEGPIKMEVAEPVSQVSLLIADRLITAMGKQSLPPTIAPIKVPVARKLGNHVSSVAVVADGRPMGHTETITDVGTLAAEQAQATLPDAVARAVVRRVVKKGIAYGAKEAIGTNKNELVSLAIDVAGVAWEATESADTRCWSLLPDQIQVLRLELPAGDHVITLQPMMQSMNRTSHFLSQPVKVTVANGRNTYMLANFHDENLLGRIVVSGAK